MEALIFIKANTLVTVNLIAIFVLIALTAFFVASEFAVIRVRSSRIEQLIEEGNKQAIAAKHVTTHLDEYLSACQLGITITALGLGWLGEPTVEKILHPVFEKLQINQSLSLLLSVGIAFIVITFLHVVVGELAPKTIAIQKAEKVALYCSPPLIWFYRLMYPFIWSLNGSARLIIKLLGLQPAKEQESLSEEELRILLSESYKSGEINPSEYHYVNKIFEFDERIAKEIMVPRTEMVTFSLGDSLETFLDKVEKYKFTRYPIIDHDKDHVVGIVNMKEMAISLPKIENLKQIEINSFLRPVQKVIETIPVHDLLVRMQKDHAQMVILIDEYGGTAGLVTIKDILEEIVGEIKDEFDDRKEPSIKKLKNDSYLVNGKTLINQINLLLNLDIEDAELDTIGGWMLAKNVDIQEGQSIHYGGYRFTVKKMKNHTINVIKISKVDPKGEKKGK